MAGAFAILVAAAVLGPAFVQRVRARAQSDWLEHKNLTLAPAVKGLREPTYVAFPPDGSGRAFVLERDGVVRVADANGKLQPDPFVDLRPNVSTSNEQGLLGLAFHPHFQVNGYVYIS